MIPACFICGSEYICGHREADLHAHWLRMGAEYPPTGRRDYTARKPVVRAFLNEGFRLSVTREDAERRRG